MKKVISLILVAVMLVSIAQLQTMADILSAVETGAEEQAASVQTVNAPILKESTKTGDTITNTTDNVYVSSISVTETKDGTAPFDSDNNPGNDNNESNGIVRTFDTISYKFKVQMNANGGYVSHDERVKFEFSLPLTSEQAVFDTSAMAWMDTTADYAWKITTDETTKHQTLTCYAHITDSEHNVATGEYSQNVVIKVTNMKDYSKDSNSFIQPTFKANIDKSGATATQAAVTPDSTQVSAAPKYEIRLDKTSNSQVKQDFDFSTGDSTALNKDIGTVNGRISTYGITIQVLNDSVEKQLKGIELPSGDLTFDITLGTKFQAVYSDSSKSAEIDVNDIPDYTPLVWAYNEQKYTGNEGSKSNGRFTGMTSYDYAFTPYTPINRGTSGMTCYNGGDWSATQSGNIIHFTISNYEFNGKFPADNGRGQVYPANVGCFSAGQLYIVQPFYSKTNGTYNGTNGTYAINDSEIIAKLTDKGDKTIETGQFNITLTASNLKESTQSCATTKYGNLLWNSALRKPGSFEVRTLYSGRNGIGMFDVNGKHEYEVGNNTRDGYDAAVLGQEITLTFGGAIWSYDSEDKVCSAKFLLKFDPDAIELDGDVSYNDHRSCYDYKVFYGIKSDGKAWTDNTELKNTQMQQLKYYNSLATAQQNGTVVAVLAEITPKNGNIDNIPIGVITPYFRQNAKVKTDENLANTVHIITSDSIAWTVDGYNKTLESNDGVIPSFTDDVTSNEKSNENTYNKLKSNIKYNLISNSKGYTEVIYNENGNVTNSPTANYYYGDSLLVLEYKSSITAKLAQNSGNEIKVNYDAGTGQRYVDFVLSPKLSYGENYSGSGTGKKTTVTITATLPEQLSYVANSAYYGGEYTQNSADGGVQGTVSGGLQIDPTGTDTLVWTIENVTVREEMGKLYFTAKIGNPGGTDDIAEGTTNLLVKTQIRTTEDYREIKSANGNYDQVSFTAFRGSAAQYGKYALESSVNPDGNIDYKIFYNAPDAVSEAVLLDTMPAIDKLGNDFNGTYSVNSWQLDTKKYGGDISNLKLYYAPPAGTTFTSTSNDPQLNLSDTTWTDLTTDDVKKIKVTASGITAGQKMDLFYAAGSYNGASESRKLQQMSMTTGEQEFVFDLSSKTDWTGNIRTIRIDPFAVPNKDFTIKEIAFLGTDNNVVKTLDFTQKDAYKNYLYSHPNADFKFVSDGVDYSGRIMYGTDNPVTLDTVKSWNEAVINDDGTATFNATPTAWAIVGPISAGKSIDISTSIKLDPDLSQYKEISKYINTISNESFTMNTLTTSVRRMFVVEKDVVDAKGESVNATDKTSYNFVLSRTDKAKLNELERIYLKDDGTTAQIPEEGTFSLAGGESINFIGLSNSISYNVQETDSEEYTNYVMKTECNGSETKNYTFKADNSVDQIARFTNILKSFTVNLKYYGRETVNGKPTNLKSTPTTYTKSYIKDDYLKYINSNNSDDPIAAMITATGVKFGESYNNVLDEYILWTSQKQAESGIANLVNSGDEIVSKKYTDDQKSYHGDCYGNPTSEKWYTYNYIDTAKNTDYESSNNKTTDSGNVSEVTIWLFNTPKQYNVYAYEAKTDGDLTPVGDKYVANTNLHGGAPIKAYYNQRLGLSIGPEYDTPNSYLAGYGIDKAYTGTKLDTAAVIGDKIFAYWSFDSLGKTIASTDIRYNYRITKETRLYAVYNSTGKVNNDDTVGLTVSMDEPDVYFNSKGVSLTRLNTVMNPYNCKDEDENIRNVAAVYLVSTSTEPKALSDTELDAIKQAVKEQLPKITKEESFKTNVGDSSATAIQITGVENVTKGNYFVYYVDGFGSGNQGDTILTNKNRIEFTLPMQTNALMGKRMFAFAAMLYGSDSVTLSNNTWYVSDNYIDYTFTSDGAYTSVVIPDDKKNYVFDAKYYASKYPALAEKYGNDEEKLFNHYLLYGIKDGLQAHPVFDAKTYLNNNTDLITHYNGNDNYVGSVYHYETYGINEDRTNTAPTANLGNFTARIKCAAENGKYINSDGTSVTASESGTKLTFTRLSDGLYTIRDEKGKFLGVNASQSNNGKSYNVESGTNIILFNSASYSKTDVTLWCIYESYTVGGDKCYVMRARSSNKQVVLNVSDTDVTENNYDRTLNQQFKFEIVQ